MASSNSGDVTAPAADSLTVGALVSRPEVAMTSLVVVSCDKDSDVISDVTYDAAYDVVS